MADTTLYKQIVLEWGQDTDSLIWGMGYSPDNGEHFYVLNTTYGRKYRTEDGDRIWPFIVDKVKAVLDWSNITNKPDLALKTDLTWSNITGKPDVALKSDVAAVSAVASNASAKADSNAKLIAGKASQEDLNSVSSTASSALDKATSNANALTSKVNKSDLVWSNITNRPDFDSIASQASQAVVTANTAESQASAAGQAAASATAQASAAKTTADTATATANAAKASASTASATAASAQQVANSASASASATAVALKSKADTATVNTQFTAVNSNVASAQSTADSAVAGLDNKLDKTALTWGNIANKPTDLATTDSVAKAQSAANSAVSMASGATATANSAKSAATSAVGVANTANTTADSALSKANSAATVANQANSTANQAVTTANQAKSTADSINSKVTEIQANGGGRNLAIGTASKKCDKPQWGADGGQISLETLKSLRGQWITISCDMSWTGFAKSDKIQNRIGYELGLHYSDGNYLYINNWYNPSNSEANKSFRFSRSWKLPDKELESLDEGWLYNQIIATTCVTSNLMIEKGTVAHDWSPAPEDIQTQIDANKTAAANAQTSANNAQTSANSALSKANNAQNTANSAQTSANNAQNTANSAQSTANTAIKVSETLKDLGNYTATASGTTSNSTYAGLPRTSGVSMSRVYNNGYPTPYGNVLNVAGVGSGQLLLGWSGTSSANEHLYYRSHRDNGSGGWSTWDKIAYVSDLTWSNISGKPNVATKSDLTWANISGKPSIPSTFNGTITSTSTDFNSLVTEGHYDIRFSPSTQGKNGPNQSNWGLLDVKVAGRMIVQTYYSDQSNEVYVRNCYDGTWTAWRWVTFWPS